jgi:polysaccharide biosynthesis transport protein
LDSSFQKELALQDLPVIFRRRRKIIYRTLALFVFLAVLYSIFATRRYEADGTIQVQAKSLDRLGLENLGNAADSTSQGEPDALSADLDIQTQANILKSDTLALKTIEKLNLENTPDFKPRGGPMAWVAGLFSSSNKESSNVSLEDSPARRRRVLTVFGKNLSVSAVNGTRLISLSYMNPDPRLAAAVVNTLMQSLIDYSFQTRFEATNQAASWLSTQLNELREQSDQLQRKVADMESKNGVYSLGTTDPRGRDQAYSGTLDQLQQATTALSQAEQNRILREAILQATEKGDAEMISGLAGNSSNSSEVNNSLALIQNLRAQQSTQQAALQQAQTKFGPAYPRVAELRSNVASLQQSIQQEIDRLKQRARNDYEDAVRTEAQTRSQYEQIKSQADTVNDKAMDLAIVRQEADESRKLYQQLLQRFKEAGVLEGLKGSTVTIVDPGRVPDRPKTPSVPRYIAGAIAGGLIFGCFMALVVEVMDTRIHTIDEVQRISNSGLLGVTPLFPLDSRLSRAGISPLASLNDPQSPFVEAARTIRTKILLNGRGDHSKVVLVTSSVSGEGKTVLSSNLAVLLAQSGKKVLLVDTDLRLGALNLVMNLPSSDGLSELLSGESPEPAVGHLTDVPNLDVLQAGSVPDNPSELLGSNSFGNWLSVWRESYDYILLDSAPLLPVTDSLTLAPVSDLVLLLARSGLTQKSELAASYQLLMGNGNSKKTVGIVLNGLQPKEEGYSTYFTYRKPVGKYEIIKAAK